MTDIKTILKQPDSDIKRSGFFVKTIFEEYRKISGIMPKYCDCKLKQYTNYLRQHYGING